MIVVMVMLKIAKLLGFPGGSVVKNLPAKAVDKSLIPDPGRTPQLEKSPHNNKDPAQPKIKKE